MYKKTSWMAELLIFLFSLLLLAELFDNDTAAIVLCRDHMISAENPSLHFDLSIYSSK